VLFAELFADLIGGVRAKVSTATEERSGKALVGVGLRGMMF